MGNLHASDNRGAVTLKAHRKSLFILFRFSFSFPEEIIMMTQNVKYVKMARGLEELRGWSLGMQGAP